MRASSPVYSVFRSKDNHICCVVCVENGGLRYGKDLIFATTDMETVELYMSRAMVITGCNGLYFPKMGDIRSRTLYFTDSDIMCSVKYVLHYNGAFGSTYQDSDGRLAEYLARHLRNCGMRVDGDKYIDMLNNAAYQFYDPTAAFSFVTSWLMAAGAQIIQKESGVSRCMGECLYSSIIDEFWIAFIVTEHTASKVI